MEKFSSLNPEVTFYIRTAKKIGFIEKSKKSVLNSKELKELVQKKTKIPPSNQILYYNGQEVKQNKTIKIVEKSIVHVIDSRNVGQPRMKLSVKRLQNTPESEDFQVDSNTSIDEFIKRELEPFYEQPAEKLFFVYSGRQLKRQRSFCEEHVETETEIVCVHADKDRKNKTKIVSKRSSANSLQSKDTIETKTALTPKKQQLASQDNQQVYVQNANNDISEANRHEVLVEVSHEEQAPLKLYAEVPKKDQEIIQSNKNQSQPPKAQRKVIRSIQQIECGQIQSDQDSDNETNTKQANNYPQKLPEEYLMQQTRQRSNTKSDHHNNSGSSSISQPNFKKKKKVSEVDFVKSSEQKKQEETSPKSLSLNKSPSGNLPEFGQRTSNEHQKTVENEQSNKFKTRDEIFQNNLKTYSSVIDEPQEPTKIGISLQSGNLNPTNEREDIFSSYYNRQQNQVYDSQMNYGQGENARMEVRGFMNFSSASFLEPSQVENTLNPTFQHHEVSFRQTNNLFEIRNTEAVTEISSRAPEFLAQDNQLNPRRQYSQQIGGDSLSFSKEQSELKPRQESQDNLFVEYRRGPRQQQRNNNIMIREDEASESNLLSETYNNQNATEMMNSITFNLEPNPDELITYSKQSAVHIVDEDQIQEQNHAEYEKRDSEVETNIRDSANPSQIYSNTSSQINQKNLEQNVNLDPMSLIDGLASMIDYQIHVNSIDSQDSLDDSVNHPKRNYVDPQSDISYDPSNNEQLHEHTIQTLANHNVSQNTASNIFLDDNSDVFVQFQAYTTNFQPSFNGQNKQKIENQPKQFESNLLEQNSFGMTHERSLQSGLIKKTLVSDSSINVEQYYKDRNSAIKIVEEDSLHEQHQPSKYENQQQVEYLHNSMHPEDMERSAAFHEISQSLNNQKIEESSNFINNLENPQPYEVTFRKDHKFQQNKFEDQNPTQSKMEEPQGSRLLYELSMQAMNETEQPQLLPGDYIYSTDRVQTPDEALDSILNKFAHCFY